MRILGRTGGCFDRLQEGQLNQSEGAESTLAFLLALAEMERLERSLAEFRLPELRVAARPSYEA